MASLPDFNQAFEFENNFYLSCDIARIGKFISHYELFKASLEIPGAIVECGVFVGASFLRFAIMRQLFGGMYSKKMVGFDTFGEFPKTTEKWDTRFRDRFVSITGTETGISVEDLYKSLANKGITENVDLVAGDILELIPKYCAEHPELRISLLNLDTCTYDSCKTILEHLYPLVSQGGVVILDDYAAVEGETRADEEYFSGMNVKIRKHPFARSPCYLIKE